MRSSAFLLIVALLAGCPKPNAEGEARLEAADVGIVVSYTGKHAPVPMNDLGHAGTDVLVSVEEGGKRLAYPLPGGGSRIVYVVGDDLFVGPSAPAVRGGGRLDFSGAPSLDDALGAIFTNAEGRRAQAVAAVKKEKGDAGVARMLGMAPSVDDPAWDDAFKQLPEGVKIDVKNRVAALLEPGAPKAGLRRAVRFANLGDPSRAGAFAARIRELAAAQEEPAPTAVLLRALTKLDKAQASEVGCEVLHRKPKDDVLREASFLAIARGAGDCDAVDEAALGDDWCLPYFRCAAGKPLSGREATKQDEPLCTRAELDKTIEDELARTAEDVMAPGSSARPGVFAYAAMLAKNHVPPAFVRAHERRRYALTEPKDPQCESGVAPGTPCHCEEAVLRDQACRRRESSNISVGVCRYDVDDKAKKITNVVATPPP